MTWKKDTVLFILILYWQLQIIFNWLFQTETFVSVALGYFISCGISKNCTYLIYCLDIFASDYIKNR